VGLLGNVDTGLGLFTPAIEWRVSTMIGSRERFNVPTNQNIVVNFFSSIPRFKLLWFPSM
jgi:hypothetical protein